MSPLYLVPNKSVSFSTGVISTTSVSRPQLKSNPKGDRVLHNNSHGKKLDVEEHRRDVKLSKNKIPVTACTANLNAKTVNVKSVSAMCAKSVMINKHDLRVPKYVAKPFRKPVASESIKKPRNNVRKLNEGFGKISKWTYIKFTPSGRSTVSNTPLSSNSFTAHRDCPIHRRLWVLKAHDGKSQASNKLCGEVSGMVKFGNDQIAPILGYGDLVQGAVTIKRVYYVEGLNYNLFSVGQFYDADLEVAFRKSTCFIRDLKGNDLLTGSRGSDLYSISLQSISSPNPICLMAKATSSQAWLWHRRLSHLNFDTINLLSKNDIVVGLPKLKFVKDHLCSSCELGKAKRKRSTVSNTPLSSNSYAARRDYPIQRAVTIKRVDYAEGLNHNLFSVGQFCDADLEVAFRKLTCFIRDLKGNDLLTGSHGTDLYSITLQDINCPNPICLMAKETSSQAWLVQRGLQAQVRVVRTDKGTKFLNQTLHAYFAAEGILHQTSVARTPELNGVVERRNRTLVEAA
uniref:Retrovirus-related Pol polyprotein from transposon TNT 1-94 n=1 Tax=Tanacetum cinerariifolium TaxID=118510 RepID=A0A6L2P060_TANCI|nr:retrovirus-related Pol polyprotein from transposon TNT 1-94 [Tanacetum cinerariifolium]